MRSDKLYIYPTDTVWGIGGTIYNEKLVKDISKIKQNSDNKPLSILFSDIKTVKKYFDLPENMTDSWLKSFFALESSLALPLSLAAKEIPNWITAGSDCISIRCLDYDFIAEITDRVGGPITTTSLNLTGNPPITNLEDAKLFCNKYCDEATFIANDKVLPSGRSSSIVLYQNSEITFWRKGAYAEKLQQHCRLLSA